MLRQPHEVLGRDVARSSARTLVPGELAWLAVAPCAIVVLAAIVVLGPVLGHALLSPGSEVLWPSNFVITAGRPEPAKHGRYVVAMIAPVLLAAVVLAGSRRGVRLRPGAIRVAVASGQVLALAFVVVAVLGQNNLIAPNQIPLWPIFSVRTLVVAALLPLLLAFLPQRPRVAAWIAQRVRDTGPRRIACVVVAAAIAALWLLTAVSTEATVGDSQSTAWTMDDPFAILDGRTPLVDFHAFYAQLWPFVAAAALRTFGTTTLCFALVMTIGSGLALLAMYAVLRRVARSALLGLALYLPFLATGFLLVVLGQGASGSNVALYAMWPMRYAGPYFVVWLTARHVDGAAPRRAWVLFLVAGLAALDNLEFGLAALAATLVALVCAQPRWSRRAIGQLLAGLGAGLLAVVVLTSLLTLLRAGELPHFGFIFEFPRIFGVLGLASMPMPLVGFHLVLYATFVAAIAVAVVRATSGAEDRLLTSMLAWSGVFGLIAAGYYLGRSDTLKLVSLFSAWSFSLALMTVAVVRGLAAQGWRRPRLAELIVLFGFGLAICSLRELPSPWSQADRLSRSYPAPQQFPAAKRFVAADTRHGEKVAILIPLSHRIAYEVGVTNVSPYSHMELIVTLPQMRTLLAVMRREHVHKLFLPLQLMASAHYQVLTDAGFVPYATETLLAEWTDT